MDIKLQPNITGTNVTLVKGATQADLTNAVNNAKTYRDEAQAFSILSEDKSIESAYSALNASVSATTAIDKANIATTKANEASNSANSASASETVCIAKATIATDKADIATAQSVIATDKANDASISANTATTQAGIATTKALEASNSATSAYNSSVSADNSSTNASDSESKANKWADNDYNVEVETGKYSAKHWATVSQNSIGVKVVENISSLKTFNVNEANQIEVLGYYTKGDGGGGLFYWDNTSIEIDNGGTIIQATGITTGRWKRVFSGAVNVKWFGAVGDGVTDDTDAVRATIAICQFGGSVYVPTGTYICNLSASWDGIDFPSWDDTNNPPVGFTIYGDGPSSILKSTSDYVLNLKYVQSYDTYSTQPRWLTIHNISIVANKSGIRLQSCQSARIYDVVLNTTASTATDYMLDAALHLTGCGMFRVANCGFRLGASVITGIRLGNNSSDAVIEGCDIAGGKVGVLFEDVGDIRLVKNGIYNQAVYNVLVNPQSSQDISQLYLSQNQLEVKSGAVGIKVTKPSIKAALDSVVFDNMVWLHGGADGIYIDNAVNWYIHNNLFVDAGGAIGAGDYGVYVTSGSDIAVKDNIFKKINTGGVGIYVYAVSRCYINGNVFNSITDNATSIGIRVRGTGCNNVQIANNFDASYGSSSYFIKVDAVIAGARYAYNKKNGSTLISLVTDQYNKSFDNVDMYDIDGLKLTNSSYQYNRFIMGNHYLWVDTTGKLRIKEGSPTSNTDGVIVGTQS